MGQSIECRLRLRGQLWRWCGERLRTDRTCTVTQFFRMRSLSLGGSLHCIVLRIGCKVVEPAEERLHVILAELLAQEAEKTCLLKHLALLREPVEVNADFRGTQLCTDQQTPQIPGYRSVWRPAFCE